MQNKLGHVFAVWIAPGMIFQSLIVGPGYGTGREVVEFITNAGPLEGVVSTIVVAILMGLVLAATFDFARRLQVYEYRSFFKKLIGRFWILYELVFMAALVLVLAITGAAAGEILNQRFGVPNQVGVGAMLAVIMVFTFFGREKVKAMMFAWGVLMTLTLCGFIVIVLTKQHDAILVGLTSDTFSGGWAYDGFRFFLYNIFLAPVALYAATNIKTRSQAWGAGLIAGFLGALPAFVFHVAFIAGYPAVLDEALPTYHMLTRLGGDVALVIYVVVLFGAIVQTGVGVLQGINDRLDQWRLERLGRPFNRLTHTAVAAGALIGSLALANFGVVALVAQGYGALAWFSLLLYVIPLLVVGTFRLFREKS